MRSACSWKMRTGQQQMLLKNKAFLNAVIFIWTNKFSDQDITYDKKFIGNAIYRIKVDFDCQLLIVHDFFLSCSLHDSEYST